MTTLTLTVKEQCKRAHAASRYMNRLSTDQKNHKFIHPRVNPRCSVYDHINIIT